MGGDGEIKTEGCCEVDDTVYVAVGNNLKEGKSLLLLAVKSFPGKKICLLHVHPPDHYTQLLNRKLSSRRLKWQTDATCQEIEHRAMLDVLDQLLRILEQMGVMSGKVWCVTNNIEKGIVRIIAQHGVRQLVIAQNCRKSSMIEPSKALFVFENAPASCQIWFSYNGYLINTRLLSLSSQLVSLDMISREKNHGSTLPHADKKYNHNLQRSQSLKFKESPVNGGDTLSMGEVQLSRLTNDELENVMSEAEADAMEAMQLARVSESLCLEEKNRNKGMEEVLVKQKQDLKILTDQQEQFLKEYQMVKDQKSDLERKIAENSNLEGELVKKIIQAVTLLISFKEKRDMLRIDRDKAIETFTQLRKSIQEEEVTISTFSRIFAFSFLDIVEATNNFDPSLKIGEGRLSTVYKGTIYHVDVAIKMLPFCGSLSDLEFKQKAEVVSRVRHPNLVTMYGVCTESRSLIYEYLENGSLADYLTGGINSKINNPLPWQIRVKVMIEICSVLIFLHSQKTPRFVGYLRPDKILLDSNFVSKLSDFDVHLLVPSYLDPDISVLTSETDVYSFGILVLQLLTTKSASSIVKDVKRAMDIGGLKGVLDYSAGEWPFKQAKELAFLGLRCCEENSMKRPDLVTEVWPIIEPMQDKCCSSSSLQSTCSSSSKLQGQQHKVPSHFVCPILQEVMKDPYIAADGFTYEEEAIKGWLESGHKTSPMTNLELDHCCLLPNYALYYAIQEWQDHV